MTGSEEPGACPAPGGGGHLASHTAVLTQPPSPDSVTLTPRGLLPLPWASEPLRVPISLWTTVLVSVCVDTCRPFCRAR